MFESTLFAIMLSVAGAENVPAPPDGVATETAVAGICIETPEWLPGSLYIDEGAQKVPSGGNRDGVDQVAAEADCAVV